MIHVLTFKVGNKYSCENVNLLKRSISFHYDKPFKFYCMTDDPEGLDDDIIIVEMQDNFGYEFNSVSMTRSGFAGIPDGENAILLDIDVEVMSDPSPIFDYSLQPKQIGFIHKWWTYPYEKGSFISGMAYRFTTGELDCFYSRFKSNPQYYIKRYIKFNGREHKIDNKNIFQRGEQDYFLECAGIFNFHMNLFPSFWAENVNPEIEFGNPNNVMNPRLSKYLRYKSMALPKELLDCLIFKHYTGNIEQYLEKRANVYRRD